MKAQVSFFIVLCLTFFAKNGFCTAPPTYATSLNQLNITLAYNTLMAVPDPRELVLDTNYMSSQLAAIDKGTKFESILNAVTDKVKLESVYSCVTVDQTALTSFKARLRQLLYVKLSRADGYFGSGLLPAIPETFSPMQEAYASMISVQYALGHALGSSQFNPTSASISTATISESMAQYPVALSHGPTTVPSELTGGPEIVGEILAAGPANFRSIRYEKESKCQMKINGEWQVIVNESYLNTPCYRLKLSETYLKSTLVLSNDEKRNGAGCVSGSWKHLVKSLAWRSILAEDIVQQPINTGHSQMVTLAKFLLESYSGYTY
jgi:hypothetical protein